MSGLDRFPKALVRRTVIGGETREVVVESHFFRDLIIGGILGVFVAKPLAVLGIAKAKELWRTL